MGVDELLPELTNKRSYYIDNAEWGITETTDIVFKPEWLVSLNRSGGRAWEKRWIEQNDVPSLIPQPVFDEFKAYITFLQSLANDTTSKLLNAIDFAYNNGFAEVLLTKAKYVIKNMLIQNKSFFYINCNGSTLYSLPTSSSNNNTTIELRCNNDFSFNNAIIIGDKRTHNYKENTSHEWGFGIKVSGNINSTIGNCIIKETTGDAIYTSFYIEPGSTVYTKSADYEIGNINDIGSNESLKGYIRTIGYVPIIDKIKNLPSDKRFISVLQSSPINHGIGNDTKSNTFFICFYDNNYTFISKLINTLCNDFFIPDNASYMRWVFINDVVPSIQLTYFMFYHRLLINQNLQITNNDLHDCRRQGLSVGGGRNTTIRNNRIFNIKGIPPECGIDIEDADKYTVNTVIDHNIIQNIASHGIVVYDGYGAKVMKNIIRDCGGNSITVISDNDTVISENILYGAVSITTANCAITKNTLVNSLIIANTAFYVKDNFFRDMDLPSNLIATNLYYNFRKTNQINKANSQFNGITTLKDSDITISAVPDLLPGLNTGWTWYNDINDLTNSKVNIAAKPSNASGVTRRLNGSWIDSKVIIASGMGHTRVESTRDSISIDNCMISLADNDFMLAYITTPPKINVMNTEFTLKNMTIENWTDKSITITISDTTINFSGDVLLNQTSNTKNAGLTVIFRNCNFNYTGTVPGKVLFNTAKLASYKNIYFTRCSFVNCSIVDVSGLSNLIVTP